MPELDERLVRCFASVFPALSPDQIRTASVESVPDWDSLATVTLVAVLEQEFNVQIDLLSSPELTSFAGVRDYMCTRVEQA
jgi:acyl carrier protein